MEHYRIPSEVKCPICKDFPDKEIYQCYNGHIICGECSIDLTTCPKCGVAYLEAKVRNSALELLFDSLKFPCSNDGCPERLFMEKQADHVKNCLFK